MAVAGRGGAAAQQLPGAGVAGASVYGGSVADVEGGDGVGGQLATRTNHLSTEEISPG